MFPHYADWSQLKDPKNKKRYDAGPHGTLAVWRGPPAMGPKLAATFLFYLVVCVFVAYLGAQAMANGAGFLLVFRFTSTAAVTCYCLDLIPHAIWFGRTLRNILMDIADGVAYALITAALFSWLWPAAAITTVPLSFFT